MAEKKVIDLGVRRVKLEIDVSVPGGKDFPKDHQSEPMDKHIERALRRILTRDGGQR